MLKKVFAVFVFYRKSWFLFALFEDWKELDLFEIECLYCLMHPCWIKVFRVWFHSVSEGQSVLCQCPLPQIDMFSSDSYSHSKLWPTLHFLQSQTPPPPSLAPPTSVLLESSEVRRLWKIHSAASKKVLWFLNQERSKSRCPQITYIYKPICTEQRYAEIELMMVSNQWSLLICTVKRN